MFENIRKILFIRNDRIGDFLLNLPAIHALKETYPEAEISVVVHPLIAELLVYRKEGHPDITEIIPFETPAKPKTRSRGGFLALRHAWRRARNDMSAFSKWFSLFRRLNKAKYDLAIVSNPHKYFHLLTALLRIPCRIGYDRKWGFLLTHTLPDRKAENKKHEVEYNLDLIYGAKSWKSGEIFPPPTLTTREGEDAFRIYLNPEEEKSFLDSLTTQGLSLQKKWLAVHPFTTDPKKQWPIDKCVDLLNRLLEWNSTSGHPIEIVLIGAADAAEEKILRNINLSFRGPKPLVSKDRGISPSLKNLIGKLTLRQLAIFLKNARLLLSNDSGPVHIAASFQTETIVLFGGGSNPTRWGPWSIGNKIKHSIIQKSHMSEISVETVWQEVIQKFQF